MVEAARTSERQFKNVQFAFLSEMVLFLSMSGPYRLVLGAEDTVFWMSIRYPFITVLLNFLTLVLSVNILRIVLCEGIVLRAAGRQRQIKLYLNICHFTLSPESHLLQWRKQKQLIGTLKWFCFLPAGSDGNELQPLAILAAHIFPCCKLCPTRLFSSRAVGALALRCWEVTAWLFPNCYVSFNVFSNILKYKRLDGFGKASRNQIQKPSGSQLASLWIIFSFVRLN